MEKKSKVKNFFMVICLVILVLFLFEIFIFSFTRQVLVKYFGLHNAFTELVMYEHKTLDNAYKVQIDWEEKYPFYRDYDNELSEASLSRNNLIKKYSDIIESVKEKIDVYSTDMLFGYQTMTEITRKYDDVIGWNVSSYSEYNGIIKMSDGYLTNPVAEKSVKENADSISKFKAFLDAQDIDFLYVQAPKKVSEYNDIDISGVVDFANQNANLLLEGLEEQGIDYYDLREEMYDTDKSYHEFFYRTDQHWTVLSGLWAAEKILDLCNMNYGFNADIERLNEENFDVKIYKDWFLGSQGKKVTLARTKPDDFSLIYPKYETKFAYYIPEEGIDAVSDYSICYDMRQVEEKGYYSYKPYAACNYGDQPYMRIENQMESDDNKILFIHDSFGDCVTSCLALCEKEIESIDLRSFKGSLETFIKESKPDLVIVMYNAGQCGNAINYDEHDSLFDFR